MGIKYFEFIINKKTPKTQKQKSKEMKRPIKEDMLKTKLSLLEIKTLLLNESFYLQILLLSPIIRIVNSYNTKLQDQQLSIAKLKIYCNEVYDA